MKRPSCIGKKLIVFFLLCLDLPLRCALVYLPPSSYALASFVLEFSAAGLMTGRGLFV
jgi:hypothetical protein